MPFDLEKAKERCRTTRYEYSAGVDAESCYLEMEDIARGALKEVERLRDELRQRASPD